MSIKSKINQLREDRKLQDKDVYMELEELLRMLEWLKFQNPFNSDTLLPLSPFAFYQTLQITL